MVHSGDINLKYRCYFISVILSISGIGFFLYTQGWFILNLKGSSLSVGLAWSMFFTPSIFVLPIFGKLLNSVYSKKTIVYSEFLKAFLMIVFIPIIYVWPNIYLVYLLSSLMGILFAIFIPSLFVILKNVFNNVKTVKYSHLLEISIQIGSAVSIFLSGYIYSAAGFELTLLIGGILTVCSALLLMMIPIDVQGKLEPIHIFKEYKEYIKFTLKSILKKEKKCFTNHLFGILHQFPQNIILILNIPLIIYVDKAMRKSSFQYGIIDASIGLVAMLCGLFWSRHFKMSQKKIIMVCMPIGVFLLFAVIYCINPESYLVYFVFPFLGFFLCSSKIQCRAAVLTQTPSDKIGELTAFYQAATYLILIVMSFSISYLVDILSPQIIFVMLGVLMLLFSVYIWRSYHEKIF